MIVSPFYPRAPVAVPTTAEILALSIQSSNGPLDLATHFESPLNRWQSANNDRDEVTTIWPNAIARVWDSIGELDASSSYNIELRAVVRDGAGGDAITMRAYLVDAGDAVSVPVTPFALGSAQVTIGNGTVQEPTISTALPVARTPSRLLVEFTSGAGFEIANPYTLYSLTKTITEV